MCIKNNLNYKEIAFEAVWFELVIVHNSNVKLYLDFGPIMSGIKVEPPEESKMSDTDTVSKRKYLTSQNLRIRKALMEFSKRQEVLEEFIALEFNKKSMQRFKENRYRMAYALSITKEEMALGKKDNPKIKEMLKLLSLATNYWKREKSQINRPSNREARLRYESRVPPELTAVRLHVDFDTGLLGRKPVKRCHKCYDTSHEEKFCPFKKAESRTPEVKAMIQERFEKLKDEEGNDPLISKGYKKKHFKIDERRDRLKKEREMKKMMRVAQEDDGGNKPARKKMKMMDGNPAADEEDDVDTSDNDEEDEYGEDADVN